MENEMKLEDGILNEISQAQKEKYHVLSQIQKLDKVDLNVE
jgi:hypothetical protein